MTNPAGGAAGCEANLKQWPLPLKAKLNDFYIRIRPIRSDYICILKELYHEMI